MSLDQTELGVGTYIQVILGEPATFDVAGYAAMTWPTDSEVIDVVSIGEGGGTASVQRYTPLKSGVDVARSGNITYGDRPMQMGRHVQTDPTHQAIKSGFDGANKGKVHSLAIHYVDGSIDYQTAVISAFTTGALEANTFMFANVTFSPNRGVTTKAGTDMFKITYIAGANGKVYGDKEQIVESGADGSEVIAVANSGFEFVNWTGTSTSTTNPRTETNVLANVTLTANFAPE